MAHPDIIEFGELQPQPAKQTFWVSLPERANGEFIGRVDYPIIATDENEALEKARQVFAGVWGAWDIRLEPEMQDK